MLRFFRTVRKKLIEEDNVRKYLLYAAGEILLVMIGILLALQVGTWRDQVKRDQREVEVVQLLIRDMKAHRRSMEFFEKNLNIHNEATIRFMNGLKEGEEDSVLAYSAQTLGIWTHSPSYPTYEGLKQNGNIDIITNTEVRDSVLSYHENVVSYLQDIENGYITTVRGAQAATGKYLIRSWVASDSNWTRDKVYDFDLMMRDTEMLSKVSEAGNRRSWVSYQLNTRIIIRNKEVTITLEKYLKELMN